MKKILSLIMLILLSYQLKAQLEMINYGTPNKFEVATDLVMMPDGSKVIVGYKYDALTTAEVNKKNAIIFKVDVNDNFIWGHEFISVGSDEIKAKLASDGNVFFYGWTNIQSNNYDQLSGFVGKMNQATGGVLWERNVNTTSGIGNSNVNALLELNSGNIMIGGRTYFQDGTHCTSNGSTSAKSFMVKLDPSGNYINASTRNYPGSYSCAVSDIQDILYYTEDTLIVIAGQQNTNPAKGDGVILKMDTNYNLFNSNRLNFSHNENGTSGQNGSIADMQVVDNKLIGRALVRGPDWGSTVARNAIVKFDIPSFSLEYIKVVVSNSTHSSFNSLVVLNEHDFYFTQASSPAYYSYNSTSLIVGSAQSYITKLSDTTIIGTKTLDASGTKGFNKLRFYNNNLFGIGFTHYGNNQIGNQDVFIAQTDTSFTSFEECTFIDSNEVSLEDPIMWQFTPIPSNIEPFIINLDPPNTTKNPLVFSSSIQNNLLSIRNECICLYRDTTIMYCAPNPFVAPNGSSITTLGVHEVDEFTSVTVCDTLYYANIVSFDDILPVVQCKNDTVYLNQNGIASIDTSNVIDSIYAACGINSVYLSQENFRCKDEGDNPVTLYVTDNSGNIDSCMSTITVLDTFKFIYVDTTICEGDTLSIMGFDYFETGVYNDTVFGSDTLFPKFNTGAPIAVSPVTNGSYGLYGPTLYSSYTTQGAGTSSSSYQYLTDPFWLGNGVTADRIVNRLTYWNNAIPGYTWFGASFPIEVPVSKTYYILLAADNLFRFSLDGVVQITSNGQAMLNNGQSGGNSGQMSYRRAHIYPIFLSSGCHVISLQGYNDGNTGSAAAFAGAILDNDSTDLVNATSMANLNFLFRTDSVDNFYSSVSTLSCPDQALETDPADCADCQTCERIISVNLIVDTVQTIVVDTALCPGESIMVNGISYSTSQTNTGDTLPYIVGSCDSIRYDITVKIDTVRTEVIDTSICEGQTLFVNGETYSTNQTNTLDTARYTVSGCDSVLYNISLKIDSVLTKVIDTTLCQGDLLVVNGITYSTNQINTLETASYIVSGCDSVLYDITIQVDTFRIETIDTTICIGDILLVNGVNYSTNQTNTLDTASYMLSGCDSILYDVTIHIDTFITEVIDTTLCIGDMITVNGVTYSTNQTNTLDTLAYTISGCDSILYDITIHIDTFRTEIIDTTICLGDILVVNGVNYSINQTNTLDTASYMLSGCDSVLYDVTIHIDTFRTEIIDTTICLGDILVVNGVNYSTNQTNALDTASYMLSGCDSMLYDVTIQIYTFITEVIDTTLCIGDMITLNGITYSTNQINTLDTASYIVSGCDSVLYDITIHVDTFRIETIDTTICIGDILVVNGINYSTNQTNTLDTASYMLSGCDSVLYDVTIHIDTFRTERIDTTLCVGDILVVNGVNYSTNQINTLDTASYMLSGCDSVLYDVTIHVDTFRIEIVNTTICLGSVLTINGVNYSTPQTNTLDTAFYTVSGCDSVLYDITIHVDSFIIEVIDTAICIGDVLVVNGKNYSTTQANTLDTASYFVSGCDSVLYDITLKINQLGVVGVIPDTIAVCDDLSTEITMTASNISTYQWMANSGAGFLNVLDAGSYFGAQTNELSINPIDIGMNGDLFRLSMYDECGFGPFVDETYLRVTLPHDVINPTPDITQCIRDSSLVFVDYNGYNYIWSDGQTGQYFIPNNPGVFTVDFIENITNCSMQDEIEIFLNDCVNDCVVSLPTGFSPSNSIGKNDVFSVLTNCVNGFKTYELSIFDRWGERVFFTNNPLQGWDGTYKGTNLEIGTYVYLLDFVKDGGSEKETKSGTVTLIR